MSVITFISHDGEKYETPLEEGQSLMQIAMTGLLLALLSLLPGADAEGQTQGQAVRRFDASRPLRRLWDGIILVLAVLLVGTPLVAVAASGLTADLWRLLSAEVFRRAAITSLSIALVSASLAGTRATTRSPHSVLATTGACTGSPSRP